MPEETKDVKKQNWFAKHKILTAIGVVFLFGVAASAMGGENNTPNNSDTVSNTSNNSAETTAVTPKNEESAVPAEYKSALNKAKTYADTMHMSKVGIYDQLISQFGEKFSVEAAQYAVDNVKADWNANALAKAKTYQSSMSMSPAAIRDQLTSSYGEKFTAEEADYAVAHLND